MTVEQEEAWAGGKGWLNVSLVRITGEPVIVWHWRKLYKKLFPDQDDFPNPRKFLTLSDLASRSTAMSSSTW